MCVAGQVKSIYFLKPSLDNKEKDKKKKPQQNHAQKEKKVARSQQNKERLHKSKFYTHLACPACIYMIILVLVVVVMVMRGIGVGCCEV